MFTIRGMWVGRFDLQEEVSKKCPEKTFPFRLEGKESTDLHNLFRTLQVEKSTKISDVNLDGKWFKRTATMDLIESKLRGDIEGRIIEKPKKRGKHRI